MAAPQQHAATGEVESSTVAKVSSVPGYARPNISSRLPDYLNGPTEAIRAAFVPNSYRTIQGLSGQSITAANGEVLPFRAGSGAVVSFSDFVYECSPYDLADEDRVKQRQEHEDKIQKIAGDQPFFGGYNTHKLKFEDYAFEYVSDPYDGTKEHERQQRFLEESKCLSRPFVPPGTEKALERPTRALLGDVLSTLYRTIAADWPEAQPAVLSTSEDLIVVYFLQEKVRNVHGVTTYMNNALRRNEAVQQYELAKVPDGWGIVTADKHLMFTLRPPWVRARAFLGSHSAGNSQQGSRPAS
jgi:hypothetical protein